MYRALCRFVGLFADIQGSDVQIQDILLLGCLYATVGALAQREEREKKNEKGRERNHTLARERACESATVEEREKKREGDNVCK